MSHAIDESSAWGGVVAAPFHVLIRCEKHDGKQTSMHFSAELEYDTTSRDGALAHARTLAERAPCRACGGTVVACCTTGRS